MSDLHRLHRRLRHHLSSVPISDAINFAHRFFCAWEDSDVQRVWTDIPESLRNAPAIHVQILPWQIELLLKECLHLSPMYGTRRLGNWNSFATACNALKTLTDATWGDEHAELIWYELFRIAHLQFPWQSKVSGRTVSRYFEIYSHPQLDTMIQDYANLSREQYFRLAFSVYGFFLDPSNTFLRWPVALDEIGIPQQAAYNVLRKVSANLSELSDHSRATSELNINYPYRRSMLEQRPLLFVNSGRDQGFLCPIPRHFLNRMLDGLYFDLTSQRGFGDYYGKSFQAYILGICRWIDRSGLKIQEEQEYWVGNDRRDSLDILMQDATATLFVECKARRVSERAKYDLSSVDPIRDEMGKMIESIVRTYKNLSDGLNGRYQHWSPGTKPCYLLIVFLTDWFLFSRDLRVFVFSEVDQRLSALGIDPGIRQHVKLVTCSADDFEILAAVLRQRTLSEVFSLKTDSEHEPWELRVFLNSYFRPDIDANIRGLANFDRFYNQITSGLRRE